MKRLLVSAAALILALGAFAQDFAGKWVSELQRDGSSSQRTLELRADGSYRLSSDIVMPLNGVSLKIHSTVEGNWLSDEDTIILTPDKRKKEEVDAKVLDDVPASTKNPLEGAVKSEIRKDLKKPVTYRVVSAASDELQLMSVSENNGTVSAIEIYKRK